MSNRALRRLQQQGDIIPQLPKMEDGESGEEEDDVVPAPVKKKGKGKKKQQLANPFELVGIVKLSAKWCTCVCVCVCVCVCDCVGVLLFRCGGGYS
jgi:hypothetical protein